MNAKNRVFQGGLGLGKGNPISMHTDSSHVYRVTGTSQIEDIINCGYVRPPIGKAKGGHTGEVFWTKGNEKLFFYDKRPVIETSTDILKKEGQIGAISLDKLTGIWMFDEQQNKYVNNIQAVRNAYNQIHPEQEQISQLREQISEYDKQLNALLANMQPYMQIPKVNREISKVIEKNNEINSSQIIDSLNDYKTVVEIKQSLLSYLEQANKFIKNNVEKQQEPQLEQTQPIQQDNNQSLPDDFWKEFERPEQEQKPQEPLPDNFWDEFDNPQQMTRPERIYNDDGTYTMEYIAYQANTPLGFNQTIYDQLLQHNTDIRTKKNNVGLTSQQADAMIQAMINGTLDTNGQPIVPEEGQMTSGRHMGFINVKILGAIATIVSLVAILGIVLLNLK